MIDEKADARPCLPVCQLNFASLLLWNKGQNIVLRMLEKHCNFTSTIQYTIDGKFGGLNKDGTWNGMVGMVVRDEADVVMTTLTLTNIRKTVIDYTIPLFWEYMTLIAPR